MGSFPNWDRWAEWNGRYRDDVRRFVKGDPGHKSKLATRLAGSADLYNVNKRKPFHSINFVIAHDGFSLRDLARCSSSAGCRLPACCERMRRRQGVLVCAHC